MSAVVQEEQKKGMYHRLTLETRAAIGTYASENGVVAVARYFSRKLDRPINESSVRSTKKAYPVEQTRKRRAKEDPTVVTLPPKKKGRPNLLGADLDKKVQAYIRSEWEVVLSQIDLLSLLL